MFGGIGRRRGTVRTRISPVERGISWALLLLIAGIAAAVYVKGQHYDASLFALDPSVLAEVQARSVPGQPEPPVYEGEEGLPGEAGAAPSGLLDGLVPPGWKPLGGVERFTAETLYEKIDGRAEQYIAYDVVGLTCVSLVDASNDGRFIDIYLYDMGRPDRAFGIYSVERSEGVPPLDLGRGGYGVEASLFFWKGRYYAQVLGSESGEDLRQTVWDIARKLEGRLQDAGGTVWGLAALPEKDRVPGTVQYFPKDALSLDFLNNTYTARYRRGNTEITAFLSRQASADAAARVLAGYEDYLRAYGTVVDRRETDAGARLTGEMGGAFDVVFRRGDLIGGVTMVPDRTLAERAAADLLAGLPE